MTTTSKRRKVIAAPRRKVIAALLLTLFMLSILISLPIAEYYRRRHFLVGTWFTPADKETLVLKPDGAFQMFDAQAKPTYEGTYELHGFSHLLLQSLAYTNEGGRLRRFNTSDTMESFDSGLYGFYLYIPLYGNTMYCKLEIEFGSPSKPNSKIYRMERR